MSERSVHCEREMKSHGKGPKEVSGPGVVIVAISGTDPSKVCLQWHDPDWWVEFTPDEARNLARLMFKKADECEAMMGQRGNN